MKINDSEKENVKTAAPVEEAKVADKKEEKPKEKKKREKKTRTMTVEEILNSGMDVTQLKTGNDKKVKIKVKQKSKLKRREARMGYLFTFPWLVGAALLLIYPIFNSFWFMFHRAFAGAAGMEIRVMPNPMANFDKFFLKETKSLITLVPEYITKMILSVPVIVVFALLMAMLLNLPLKGKGIFRTIYFLPVIVVSGPVMSYLAGSGANTITAVDTQAINNTINSVLPSFLASGVNSVMNSIITILWYSGVQILIFLAAIQKIDTSLYEAAKIDGGSGWECFWKITLPTIKPMIMLNAIYTLVSLSGDSNYNPIIVNIQDRAFGSQSATYGGYGYACIYAWIFSVIVLILVGIILLLFAPKKDAYTKQIKKVKRLEKKTRKQLAKTQRRMERNNKKFEKHLEKQKAGKVKVKGGLGNE